MQTRCRWCNLKNPRYVAYHDHEWGRLSLNEDYLYELFLLECFQAGLSWECILNKRDAFCKAFDRFSPEAIARYTEDKILSLTENRGIIRSERKIRAAVQNAKVFLAIRNEYGGFGNYLTSFFDHFPIYETNKTTSPVSDAISSDLKRRGCRYVGSVTVYSYLQAVGLIFSHEAECFLYHTPERTSL